MAKTAEKSRRLLFAAVIVSAALITGGTLLLRHIILVHRQNWVYARKEAFVRADRVELYNNIRLLEEDRRQNIVDLIARLGEQTNVNTAIVHLLAEAHVYVSVRVSNFVGSDMFVDPWGVPYKIAIATNTEISDAFGRHMESRIIIERGGVHE